MFDFNEKSVLITSGSRDLGRDLALRLSAEGARFTLVARQQAELDETVKDISRSGGVAYGIIADVGDKESVYPIVGQAAPVDILINNARSTMQDQQCKINNARSTMQDQQCKHALSRSLAPDYRS
jgi:NAD(P)-dependent dehydrogenase (short-subunit alcohol dehydrogenase family)